MTPAEFDRLSPADRNIVTGLMLIALPPEQRRWATPEQMLAAISPDRLAELGIRSHLRSWRGAWVTLVAVLLVPFQPVVFATISSAVTGYSSWAIFGLGLGLLAMFSRGTFFAELWGTRIKFLSLVLSAVGLATLL